MSTRRFPAAPNSKPSQLPYGWGARYWVLVTGDGEEKDEFKIQDSEPFFPNFESRIPCSDHHSLHYMPEKKRVSRFSSESR